MKQTESNLIETIRKMFNVKIPHVIKGIGDDCAVVKKSNTMYSLYTCDSQVEGVHFTENQITPQQLGKRAVTVAISDIAAMGGKPLYILVSLFLPQNYNKIYELNKGIFQAVKKYGVSVIGGNISRSEKLIIDVFTIGEVEVKKLVLRSCAKPDDLVFVTGILGNAASYLSKKKYFEPKTRLQEAQIIASLGATSMIDLSDGLSTDLSHICDESGVGVEVFEEKIPKGKNSIDQALNGGEDYELCFTAPKKSAQEIIKRGAKETGTRVTIIGEITKKEQGRWIVYSDGTKKVLEPKGWDHLS